MSGRREKLARGLYFHAVLGGYYPAMDRSRRQLESMRLPAKKLERIDRMTDRKAAKKLAAERRWLESEEGKAHP